MQSTVLPSLGAPYLSIKPYKESRLRLRRTEQNTPRLPTRLALNSESRLHKASPCSLPGPGKNRPVSKPAPHFQELSEILWSLMVEV